MKRRMRWATLGCAVAVSFAVVTGAAAAGGHGNGDGHGNGNAHAATPPSQSSGAQHARSEHSSHASTTASKRQTSRTTHQAADGSKQYGNGKSALEIAKKNAPAVTSASQLSGPGKSGLHKVTICHKTGSGYVLITVDVHALKSGHTAAKGDIIPAPSGGCPTASTQSSQATQQQESKSETESQSETKTQTESAQVEHKVTICHATGSATNPYVEITVDRHALKNGHTAAKGDIIPAPAGGCPTASQTKSAVAGTQEQQQSACGTTTETVTTQVVDGIWHHTGSKTNPYVLIHPSGNSAHWSKHTDDIPNVVTETKTITVAGNDESCQSSQQQTAATQEQQQNTTNVVAGTQTTTTETPTTSAVAAAQTPANTAGVAGAQKTLRRAASPAATTPRRGGVLGAVHTLASATLPFTGFPIWAAVLAAALAIGVGVLFNRVGTARR